MKPLVSVITPVFNRERLIGRAIQSVVEQSYSPVEILIVDDGSTDRTVDIVQQFPQAKLLHNTGRVGPAGARNTGIREAKGEYLAFLDSDDYWKPDKLELQISKMMQQGIDFSFTQIDFENYPPHIEHGLAEQENIFNKLLRRNFICTSSVVLHRRVIERVGVFDEQFFGTEDLDLWLRAALHFDSLFLREALGVYSRNDDSIISLSGAREGQIVDRSQDRIRILEKARKTLPLTTSRQRAIDEALSDIFLNQGYEMSSVSLSAGAALYLKSLRQKPSMRGLGALVKLPLRRLLGRTR